VTRSRSWDRNTKRVAAFSLPAPLTRIIKLSLLCDGAGGGAPTTKALVKGVIYQGDVLVATGDEVVVMAGDPLAWVDLPFLGGFPEGAVVPALGAVEYGLLVGGDASVLRVAQIDPSPPGGRWNSDSYTDGPSNPFGSTTSLTANMSIFATSSPLWIPRDTTTPDVLARMGWTTAQDVLASSVLTSPTYDTAATWHGTAIDPNRGSFAVVRADSPLAGLVGERIKVTTSVGPPRSCLAYVFQAVSTLDADLSLARRAFAELELLAADFVDVHVEVLG
jgi:hypothetical protein